MLWKSLVCFDFGVTMENKLEVLRFEIDRLITENSPESDRNFFVHLYGVSQFCTLLALKRNLNAELAAACGMLHDIYPVLFGDYENHGIRGAEYAKKILKAMGLYDDEEIKIITNAVSRHCDKSIIQEPYDEVLKDGDVMSHCLYNTGFPINDKEKERYKNILLELGCV
jgi:uncharacterized protein